MRTLLAIVLLVISTPLFAENFPPVPALKPMPSAYLNVPGQVTEVGNMPEGITQGGLPICFGVTAWHLYQQHVCKQAHSDCKHLDPSQTASPLALSSMGISSKFTSKYKTSKAIPYSTGGSVDSALFGLSGMDNIHADACFPWTKFAQKYHEDDRAMWKTFENLRIRHYDKFKAEGKACIDCLQDTLRRDFDLDVGKEKIEAALNEEVFERFLYDIFLKDCKTKVEVGEYYVKSFTPSEQPSYAGFIDKVVSLLKMETPVAASFCADKKFTEFAKGEKCKNGHIVVVYGYRHVCPSGSGCLSYLRVLNSWGDAWQVANSNGWIDAQNFYEYMDKDAHAVEWITASYSGLPR